MAMFYELWDVRSGNIVNTYETEDEALAMVRALVADNGPDYVHVLSLSAEDDETTSPIAMGIELGQRAQRALVRRRRAENAGVLPDARLG